MHVSQVVEYDGFGEGLSQPLTSGQKQTLQDNAKALAFAVEELQVAIIFFMCLY